MAELLVRYANAKQTEHSFTSNSLKNLRLVVYTLSLHLERGDYSLERSDHLVERSDQRMERSGLERSGNGTKWP